MSADMYPRPSRDEIARQLKSAMPSPSAVACFTTHLSARMRVLGWDVDDLKAKAEISAHVAGRMINGNGVELATAEKIAKLLGRDLPYMLMPYQCGTCAGEPPKGFSCLECGAETKAA